MNPGPAARTRLRRSPRLGMACAFAATLAGIVAGWGIAAAVFWPARAYGILAGGIACTVLYNRWLHGLWRPGKTGTGS